MEMEWNEAKNASNLKKHGVPFEALEWFDFDTSTVSVSNRNDCDEVRYKAQGFLNGRLHILVFTLRDDKMRAISLRKANTKEMRKYHDS